MIRQDHTPTVLTVGTFDMFHAGHVELFRACHLITGHVVVGVNTDRFVSTYKPKPPVVPLVHRIAVVRACRYVEKVVENDSPDLRTLILNVGPRFVAVGTDWAGGTRYFDQTGITQDWLDVNDIVLLYVSRPVDGPSSTRIKAAL